MLGNQEVLTNRLFPQNLPVRFQVADFGAAAQIHPVWCGAAASGHVQLGARRELLTLRTHQDLNLSA